MTPNTKDVADMPLIDQRSAIFHSARLHGCKFFVYALGCDRLSRSRGP